MTEINQYGLRRYIPADIARQVRQECGFGCVICGLAIAQYEHIDPPFAEAKMHDPEHIALLCAACHDRITRGFWSKQRVAEARKSPITFKRGCSKDAFEIAAPFTVQVGSNYFSEVRSIIRRGDGETWFSIDEPEEEGGPLRVSATFFDREGVPSLVIADNEWRCRANVWDLTVEGRVIEIRQAKSALGLRLRTTPPSVLAIERLRMRHKDIGFEIDSDGRAILEYGDATRVEMESNRSLGADAVYTLP